MSNIVYWQNLLERSCAIVRKTILASIAISFTITIHIPGVLAEEIKYTDFPFLIYCEVGGIHHGFYLSKISQDGVAVYISQSGQAGTITLTGKPQQVGGDNSGSCAGQTLEQLRSARRAFYLQR